MGSDFLEYSVEKDSEAEFQIQQEKKQNDGVSMHKIGAWRHRLYIVAMPHLYTTAGFSVCVFTSV